MAAVNMAAEAFIIHQNIPTLFSMLLSYLLSSICSKSLTFYLTGPPKYQSSALWQFAAYIEPSALLSAIYIVSSMSMWNLIPQLLILNSVSFIKLDET